MPKLNAPLTREQAGEAVAAVEAAIRDGARWPLPRGSQEPSALAIAAKALGLQPSTMRNRLFRAEQLFGLKPNGVAPPFEVKQSTKSRRKRKAEQQQKPEAYQLGGSAADRRVVQLEGENARLRQELRSAHIAATDADTIRAIIGGLASAPEAPPAWLDPPPFARNAAPEVPVTIWSDWHAGEVVQPGELNGVNAFSLDILDARVRRLVRITKDLCHVHGPGDYPGIVINLLGDFVSGGLHPELLKTDEAEILPCVLHVRDLLIWALDRMLESFGRAYVPCTPGNHGRATQKPEFKRYTFKNFDWLIYQLLARHYAGDSRIHFDIPESNEVLYRVFGQRYLAMHGDMLGVKGGDGIIGSIGPIMRGSMKVGKQMAAIGRDFDVLIMGHWHQPLWLPGIIVAGTLKGFDEYAKNALRAPPSTPSQPLWFVHPKWGKTAHRDIFLEDPALPATDQWVGWKEAA